MKKHVFVMIRYSVLTESKESWVIGRDATTEEYKKKLFANDRLALHQKLFFNVTLPSLRKMNAERTTVLVFTSDELPDPYLSDLMKETSGDKNIKVLKLPRDCRVIGKMENQLNKELQGFNEDVLYASVRLDDDDALSGKFFKALSKYLTKDFVGHVVSFPRGVAGMYDNDEYSDFYAIHQSKIAMGLTLINYVKKGEKATKPISIYGLGNHVKVDEKAPLILDESSVMYLRTVHGQSDAYSNKLKQKMNKGSALGSGFFIGSLLKEKGMPLTIPFKMYNKIRNLGDSINPDIIRHVGSQEPVFTPTQTIPHLVGVGSIMFYANQNSHIWGTGILNEKKEAPKLNQNYIHALRGKKTVQLLTEYGYRVPDVPLGDPGYFVKEMYPSLVNYKNKKYKACVIPHHADIKHPAFQTLGKEDGVYILNMMTSDVNVLEKIAESEVVISQSLHGLVFAEALGVPNLWVSFKDNRVWNFKFLDWFSTTRNPQDKPVDASAPLAEMIQQATLHDSLISLDALRSAFPLDEVSRKVEGPLLLGNALSRDARVCNTLFDGDVPGTPFLKRKADDELLLSLQVQVRDVLQRGMSVDPGSKYNFIGGCEFLNEGAIEKIISVMDEKYKFGFGAVASASNIPPDEKVYEINGVLVGKNKCLSNAFVVRPHGRFNVKEEFLTFYV